MLTPEVIAGIPAGPNLKTGLFGGGDEANEFWVDKQERLTARWNAWVAQ